MAKSVNCEPKMRSSATSTTVGAVIWFPVVLSMMSVVDPLVAAPLATVVEEDELRLILQRFEERLQRAVIEPGPPCRQTTIGRSRIMGPSRTSPIPPTSK
jgi:hypothetical protein